MKNGRMEIMGYKRGGDTMPPRSKKYFRSTKSGAGMTKAGVAKYRRDNPGAKLESEEKQSVASANTATSGKPDTEIKESKES